MEHGASRRQRERNRGRNEIPAQPDHEGLEEDGDRRGLLSHGILQEKDPLGQLKRHEKNPPEQHPLPDGVGRIGRHSHHVLTTRA